MAGYKDYINLIELIIKKLKENFGEEAIMSVCAFWLCCKGYTPK